MYTESFTSQCKYDTLATYKKRPWQGQDKWINIQFNEDLFLRYSKTSNTILEHHALSWNHDDVIKWKHFPRNWPFVREIHRSPVNFPHKGQWRGALMFSLIYAWINDWVNNREAGDLRRQHGHYDVIVMCMWLAFSKLSHRLYNYTKHFSLQSFYFKTTI